MQPNAGKDYLRDTERNCIVLIKTLLRHDLLIFPHTSCSDEKIDSLARLAICGAWADDRATRRNAASSWIFQGACASVGRVSQTLHSALAGRLMQEISAGQYPPGSLLPSEADLARQTGLARGTVRMALATLAKEGLVDRRRGSGTRVLGRDATRRVRPDRRGDR